MESHLNDPRGRFAFALDHLRSLTPEQRRQSLIDAGILNPDGTLADHYLPKAERKRKAKRAAVKQAVTPATPSSRPASS